MVSRRGPVESQFADRGRGVARCLRILPCFGSHWHSTLILSGFSPYHLMAGRLLKVVGQINRQMTVDANRCRSMRFLHFWCCITLHSCVVDGSCKKFRGWSRNPHGLPKHSNNICDTLAKLQDASLMALWRREISTESRHIQRSCELVERKVSQAQRANQQLRHNK